MSVMRCAACLVWLLATATADVVVYTQDVPHEIMQEFRDLPASFGPDLPPDGMTGFVVPGEPSDGCMPLAKPPVVDNFTGRWIVLVARYNCSFEEKVRNAQTAGYHCVIVHNVNSSDLETMSASDPEGIVIPSVFVSELAGLRLAEEYNYTNGYFVMVNGDLPFNINTHLLLPFAIVVVICLLVILIFMIVKCIKDRRRRRRHRLPNRCLRNIPTCKFSKGDPYDTCAICLDDYVEGERLRVLPCAHAYHAKCIDPWLTKNRRVCPVCKRKVVTAGERPRVRRDSDSDTDDTGPLVASVQPTQGGTFDEQTENPFARAARFMARLRAARRAQDATNQEALSHEEGQGDVAANDDNQPESDTAPLLPAPTPAVVTENERRRRRRRPRAVSTPAQGDIGAGAGGGEHSINAEARGEIGVAALPAPRAAAAPPGPRHVDI